jgi:hypothetical protein
VIPSNLTTRIVITTFEITTILVSKANYILDNVRVFSSRTTDFTSGGGTAYFSVVSEISPVLIGIPSNLTTRIVITTFEITT